MKLIRQITFFLVLMASAHAYAQTKVTLKFKSADFEKVINAIQKQTAYHFVFSEHKLPKKRINIQAQDEEALKVLDGLLEHTGYGYTLLPNNLVVIRPAQAVASRQLKGTVFNENNDPISGTSIRIKGSTFSTSTDQQGTFTLPVMSGAVLLFSQVGYQKREIRLKGQETLRVVLMPGTNELDEVVVTALDIKKEERKVGYAISVVPGTEMTKARESNLAYALEGRVAGLNISGVNGGPASSARILLRGVASMNAGSPLFVINGVPIDNTQRGSANEYGGADYGDGISNINPDDVETITVLRGSAASALYGARAANGIIAITLKKGTKNGGNVIEYNSNLSFDSPINNTDFQYVYGQGTQNRRPTDLLSAIGSGTLSWGEKLDGQPVIQFDGKMYPYSAVKDNIQKFYRTAPAFTNTISLSGGTEKSLFRLSASNLDYQSILRNGALNRKTFNVYTAHQFSKKFSINLNSNYIYENNKNKSYLSDGPLNANYGIASLAANANQIALSPGYDPVKGTEMRWNDDEYKTNPYFVLNKQVDASTRSRLITSATAKYDFTDWLYLQARMGYDMSNDKIVSIVPTGTLFSINTQGGINAFVKAENSEFNGDLLLAASRELTKDLHLDASVGANYRNREGELMSLKGTQFNTPYLYTPANLTTVTHTYVLNRIVTQSAYYTLDLDYKKILNVSTTGRYDVFSSLPANNRGIFVPGISGSFIFSDLLKMKGLSYGKLRASFAKTSGEPAQPYTTQTYYSSETTVNGTPIGDFPRSLPNYNLKPFTLDEFETGINLRFFNSRLDIDLTWFHRITHNEIVSAEQSVTTGFTSAYVNLGKTRNTGTEVNIQGIPISQQHFKWRTNLNFSHIVNRLLSIDGSSRFTITGKYRPLNANTALVVGKPITQIMAYDYKRDSQGNIIIGNDGIPKRGELKPMGSTLPNIYGGISNGFYYKNFNLSFLIDFKFGNKILSATENYSYVTGLNKATLEGRETGVVAPGVREDGSPNTINVPAYDYYPQLATNISALSVLNGSFIKFRQLTLGYTFTPQTLKKTPFSSISLDLVSRNLFTILKYTKNIDPESEFSPSLNYAGIEGASLPATRTFGINLNLKLK